MGLRGIGPRSVPLEGTVIPLHYNPIKLCLLNIVQTKNIYIAF